jgi:hypothetical protein
MEGDTPIPIGRAGEHRLGKVAGEFFQGILPAFGRSQDLDRDRGEAPILEEPLMSGGVICRGARTSHAIPENGANFCARFVRMEAHMWCGG